MLNKTCCSFTNYFFHFLSSKFFFSKFSLDRKHTTFYSLYRTHSIFIIYFQRVDLWSFQPMQQRPLPATLDWNDTAVFFRQQPVGVLRQNTGSLQRPTLVQHWRIRGCWWRLCSNRDRRPTCTWYYLDKPLECCK